MFRSQERKLRLWSVTRRAADYRILQAGFAGTPVARHERSGARRPTHAARKDDSTALLYPEGLRIGTSLDAKTPFAKEAYRVENGLSLRA